MCVCVCVRTGVQDKHAAIGVRDRETDRLHELVSVVAAATVDLQREVVQRCNY